jgi:hypothetical protein
MTDLEVAYLVLILVGFGAFSLIMAWATMHPDG